MPMGGNWKEARKREGGEGGRPARAGLDAEVDRIVAGLWQFFAGRG